MKEQLINFETAKIAKEKGFDWGTREFFYCYDKHTDDLQLTFVKNHNSQAKFVSRPTQAHLQKWLREKHNIDVWVVPFNRNPPGKPQEVGYSYSIMSDVFRVDYDVAFNKPEYALNVGLPEALELIVL